MQKIDWNEVYRKQSGVLIGIAYRYIRERKQAEDLVQDALIAAIQKADKFSGKGAFEAWLRKIVVNECLMYLRKAKIKTENLDDMPHVGANHDSPTFAENDEEDFDYSDDPDQRNIIERCNFSREDLLEIATHLPEHHRLVFNMYVIDHFSHKEISVQLNISEGTSKSHLNRARKKLQDLLYQKALDMQNKKKKRLLVAAWFGAMFGKVSVVDAMHRKAFADFTLLAPPPSVGLEQAIMSAPAASVGLSATATGIVAVSIAACGVGGAVGIIEYQKHQTELQQTTIEYQIPETEIFDDSILFSDTVGAQHVVPLQSQNIETQQTIDEKTNIIEEELPPLIIKKITVIDTIYED
jgi:RNA polymerase sigma factor (sigma-70 family)